MFTPFEPSEAQCLHICFVLLKFVSSEQAYALEQNEFIVFLLGIVNENSNSSGAIDCFTVQLLYVYLNNKLSELTDAKRIQIFKYKIII